MSAQTMEARMGGLESRMSRLEGGYEQTNERLGSIERRLDGMENRFENRFNWIIGLIVVSWSTTILTILFHH